LTVRPAGAGAEKQSAAVRRRALSGSGRVQVNTDEVEIHHLHNEPLAEWLAENVEAGTRIGFDALLMTNTEFEQLSATPCELVPLKASPFDTLWTDRPAAPAGLIREMPVEQAAKAARTNVSASPPCWPQTMLIIWPLRCRITSPGC
jgi:hypothetical protein